MCIPLRFALLATVVVASSITAQRELYDLPLGGLTVEVTTGTDLDGDGFADFSISALARSSVLADVSGRTGVVLRTTPQQGVYRPLRRVDLDGDGAGELISTSSNWSSGLVRVTPGAGSAVESFTFPGATAMPTGDIDGDGVRDLLIPASGLPGRVHLISGRDGSMLRSLVPPPHVVQYFGIALADLGDVNDDGRPDVVIGSDNAAQVYSLADGELLHDLGTGSRSSLYGHALAAVGDIDGDGVRDVAVGAAQSWATVEGFVRVFSGASGHEILEIQGALGDFFGAAVAGVPDMTGDGVPDILVGAPQTNRWGSLATGPGRVYLHSGADGSRSWTERGPAGSEGFGNELHPLGDVNGDGVDDVLVGHHSLAAGGNDVRVLSGAELSATGDEHEITASGGEQRLQLHGDPSMAGMAYLVLGSLSGPRPGFRAAGFSVPLAPDGYLQLTLAGAASSLLTEATGVVDPSGSARADFRVDGVPGLPPSLFSGLTFDHAFVVFDPATATIRHVTNAVPVTIR